MIKPAETKLDFDNTVSTEGRFAVRKAMELFVEAVNKGLRDQYAPMISDGGIIEGFAEFPQVKEGYINMLARRFKGDGKRVMHFPELKLSFSRYLYTLKGEYEEFSEGILAMEGTIELSLIKDETDFKIVRMHFYPRMMMQEEEE